MTYTEARTGRPIDVDTPPMAEQIRPFTVHEGLAIYRFGAGQPLLLMPYPHAWNLVGTPNFTTLVDGLTRLGRTVVTFDPPGAGRSIRPMRLDMPEMLECAEEALATCGVDVPVDVVGHSMGSYVALAFAVEHPARVRRLVLVGAGAGGRSYMWAPGALWNASHPRFRRWALFAALYWLSGRHAPEKLMSNVVARASYVDPACAPQQAVELRDG